MGNIKNRGIIATVIGVATSLAISSAATAVTLKVTVKNLAPPDGLIVSRMWLGFHDGSFDTFTPGEKAPEFIERVAEDAITAPIGSFTNTLTTAFPSSGAGDVQGTLLGLTGPFQDFFPGDVASTTFTLNGNPSNNRYFSYAAMGIPSNDAFIGNDNPLAIEIFDEEGNFQGAEVIVTGNEIWDAGTEVNDEIPENTVGLAEVVFNTGEDENGIVRLHPGFLEGGNIVNARPNADFTLPGYRIARITVEQVESVPEPVTNTGLLALCALSFFCNFGKGKIVSHKSTLRN